MRTLKPAKIEPWRKIGSPVTLAQKRHTTLFTQMFQDHRDGRTHEFVLYQTPDWSVICPLTKEGTLILVRQYKQGIDGVYYEFPSGVHEEGETATAGARRELREETGFEATELRDLGKVWPSSRKSPTYFHTFVASGCRLVSDQALDDVEVIEVVEATVPEFWDLIRSQQIRDAGTLAAATRAMLAGYLTPP